jgi:hypothetical protein
MNLSNSDSELTLTITFSLVYKQHKSIENTSQIPHDKLILHNFHICDTDHGSLLFFFLTKTEKLTEGSFLSNTLITVAICND